MKLFGKTDFIIIALVLAAAGLFFVLNGTQDKALTADIIVDGEVIESVNLDEVTGKTEINPHTEPEVIIAAENGEIFFEEAECKDKICVHTGKLSRKGDTAVCLPAKTVVSIRGSSVDAVTY
ncbi:MAG: NusG domain II-containing protein [Clostridia bacterium]|nr:NusG domain II-containing protein [Clostridia bacterium]